MQLIYEATGKPVQCGDVVHVGSWAHYVERIVQPHKPSSTATSVPCPLPVFASEP